MALAILFGGFLYGLIVLHADFKHLSPWRKSATGAVLGVALIVVLSATLSFVRPLDIQGALVLAGIFGVFGWFFDDLSRLL